MCLCLAPATVSALVQTGEQQLEKPATLQLLLLVLLLIFQWGLPWRSSWLLSANRKSAEGQTTPKPLLSALTVSVVPVLGIPYPVPGILPRLDHHRSDQDPPEIVPRVGSGTSGAALVALSRTYDTWRDAPPDIT